MPYLDKDFKPSLFEYTNVNDYNRLLVYYPAKGGRRKGLDCDFTYELLITPTPTPTATNTPTPTLTPTSTSTPTPTPTTSTPSLDPDAAAYLADVVASGGTTNPTIESAVDTLFTSLKSAGLYSKMYAMWPYVGGTAASHAINAKLNKSYDITWYGGMTHGISGSTGNSSNSYGDTGFNNNTWAQDNMSFGVYCGTNLSTGGNEQLFGYTNSAEEPAVQIAPGAGTGDLSYFRCGNSAGTSYLHGIDYKGNYIATRTGSTAGYLYRNATLFQTDSNTYTKDASGSSVYVFTLRTSTGIFSPTLDTLSFTFMGEGLSTSEVSTLDNIINTFQTSLGRNTY